MSLLVLSISLDASMFERVKIFVQDYEFNNLKNGFFKSFFEKYEERRPLFTQKELDLCALIYCELESQCFVATAFPRSKGYEDFIEKQINNLGKLVHKKYVYLKKRGQLNILREFYRHQGWKTINLGTEKKRSGCFPINTKPIITAYLFKCDSLEKVKKTKSFIRDTIAGYDSIHISDFHEEALNMARLLFLDTSISFLNSKQERNIPLFDDALQEYIQMLDFNKISVKKTCICGDSVLAIRGIKDFPYVNFISLGNVQIPPHCTKLKHVGINEDIILDPSQYFYYRGFKFHFIG
jgi:hypothetical protein